MVTNPPTVGPEGARRSRVRPPRKLPLPRPGAAPLRTIDTPALDACPAELPRDSTATPAPDPISP